VHSFPASPCAAVHLATTPPGLFIPLLGLAMPHHKRSRAQEAPHFHNTSSCLPLLVINKISMSCCGGKCGCGSSCSCGSGCTGCGSMYPDVEATAGATMVIASATNKASSGGFEAAAEGGSCDCNTCKCGTSCGCSCCSCN
ncbi:unnamed protein product, partial [Urochloa humidicola]